MVLFSLYVIAAVVVGLVVYDGPNSALFTLTCVGVCVGAFPLNIAIVAFFIPFFLLMKQWDAMLIWSKSTLDQACHLRFNTNQQSLDVVLRERTTLASRISDISKAMHPVSVPLVVMGSGVSYGMITQPLGNQPFIGSHA